MAGQPIKRMVIAELERRAKADSTPQEPLSALDYIHDYIAAGQTMMGLAEELGKYLKKNVSAGVITTWVHSTPEGRAMIAQARELAAHSFAEEAMQIVDDADEDKTALLKARLRAENRMQLASKWNRKVYGSDVAQVAVNVNLGQLHLDALRQRQVELAQATPVLPVGDGSPDYEVYREQATEPDDPASTTEP